MLQAAQGPEGALLHPNNAAVLEVKVGKVGGEEERTPGQLSQVVVSQVKSHRYLQQFHQGDLKALFRLILLMKTSETHLSRISTSPTWSIVGGTSVRFLPVHATVSFVPSHLHILGHLPASVGKL